MEDKVFWNQLSAFYKIFADSTRLQILNILLEKERCVNEIAELLAISQSAISHQLKTLRDSTLVVSSKKGQSVYYRITDDHIRIILEYGCEHLKEKKL